jgi:hypothetical protein
LRERNPKDSDARFGRRARRSRSALASAANSLAILISSRSCRSALAAISTDGDPPEAVRICLGGSISRLQRDDALALIAETLERPRLPHATVMQMGSPALSRDKPRGHLISSNMSLCLAFELNFSRQPRSNVCGRTSDHQPFQVPRP